MKKLALAVLAVVLAAGAVACSKNATGPVGGVFAAAGMPTAKSDSAPLDPRLASAINGFGFDLLRRRDTGGAPGNVTVISPVSVHIALGMAANGASGETLAEMRHTLRLDAMTEADSNQAYADLIGHMNAQSDFQLDIANSLWLDEGFSAKEGFLSADKRFFGAELRSLDLQAPSAPAAINDWVKQNTGGRIKEVVTKNDLSAAVLELVNAVYFKADWVTPFAAEATGARPFHFADGSTANVDMLSGTESWRHVMHADYEAIELPYAGGSASMIVVKTSPMSSAISGVPALTAETFARLRSELASAAPERGSLELPKVEVEWAGELGGDLKALSMTKAFDVADADFGRLSDAKPLSIGSVIHKTYLRVDEKGTEAAAVTAVGMYGSAVPAQPTFLMTVDSPYLMAIVDNDSGAVLFLATIRDPRAK